MVALEMDYKYEDDESSVEMEDGTQDLSMDDTLADEDTIEAT